MTLHPVQTGYLVKLYKRKGLTMSEIGLEVGMSSAGVWRRLKQAGVRNCWIEVECGWCERVFEKPRHAWKKSEYHYCSVTCCSAATKAQHADKAYVGSKEGRERARNLVSEWFELKGGHDGHIVHHVDGDEEHNELSNLWVFKNHSDHHRWHLDGRAEPIWKGPECVGPPRPYRGYEVRGYWQDHWYPKEGVHRRIFVRAHQSGRGSNWNGQNSKK